ncbi:SUMF1/EgtB/PvdO family nonheme iron enzyme [Arthrobacter alpinus]|nr:SUMF1/EgtB/PvdO family nonheme iron enzyme [Arthrobacter alpinus]
MADDFTARRELQATLGLLPIPGGTVQLRDARSGVTRDVELRPFTLGETQLSCGVWDLVRGSTSNFPDAAPAPVADDDGPSPGLNRHPKHPLTWFDAVRWCNAASELTGLTPAYAVTGREVVWDVSSEGIRLPTEAEWEWAARAGTKGPLYGELPDIAWTFLDGVQGPQAVAGKDPNGFGLFDMIGNVWEWCWDYADTARYGDYRSLRGAGWDDRPWSARASVRRGSAPDAVLEDVGFRVARGAVGEPGATAAQGWSDDADRNRAAITGPRPIGWTPLRR